MYVGGSRQSLALCACLLIVACAPLPQTVDQQSAGYWSQVEDFGTNPPPAGYDSGGDATFYPYVQTSPGYGGLGGYAGYGGYGYYGGGVAGFDQAYAPYGLAPPGFGSLYYATSFYGMDPYLYGRPIVVPSPGVTPIPRARPDPPPASKPPHPVTSKPPRPAVTGPAPSPRPMPPPRTGSERGAKPSRP